MQLSEESIQAERTVMANSFEGRDSSSSERDGTHVARIVLHWHGSIADKVLIVQQLHAIWLLLWYSLSGCVICSSQNTIRIQSVAFNSILPETLANIPQI